MTLLWCREAHRKQTLPHFPSLHQDQQGNCLKGVVSGCAVCRLEQVPGMTRRVNRIPRLAHTGQQGLPLTHSSGLISQAPWAHLRGHIRLQKCSHHVGRQWDCAMDPTLREDSRGSP